MEEEKELRPEDWAGQEEEDAEVLSSSGHIRDVISQGRERSKELWDDFQLNRLMRKEHEEDLFHKSRRKYDVFLQDLKRRYPERQAGFDESLSKVDTGTLMGFLHEGKLGREAYKARLHSDCWDYSYLKRKQTAQDWDTKVSGGLNMKETADYLLAGARPPPRRRAPGAPLTERQAKAMSTQKIKFAHPLASKHSNLEADHREMNDHGKLRSKLDAGLSTSFYTVSTEYSNDSLGSSTSLSPRYRKPTGNTQYSMMESSDVSNLVITESITMM
mmetsp:Transcript_6937/g.10921  ORF Transcript_6937/g.10921 Transcript_6937/m.10921 type:complete len:273 (+) Transcript_6937:147-965(+)|eukprot:CAMPEP_0184328610 /NCGR_PEP_ID=MMETSP1049-20130417/143714_1 /TAXON_ID=77928 /ORGANISM="Proteomonas sulcata, Strain CCMP704" /LENGTH=272 /DNA_ID=CAMNT_0026650933 /DNA_START=3697 /DNA_END=4515 /DNA_ORIENTATION=-